MNRLLNELKINMKMLKTILNNLIITIICKKIFNNLLTLEVKYYYYLPEDPADFDFNAKLIKCNGQIFIVNSVFLSKLNNETMKMFWPNGWYICSSADRNFTLTNTCLTNEFKRFNDNVLPNVIPKHNV